MISFACAWVIVTAMKQKAVLQNAATYIIIAASSDCYIVHEIVKGLVK